MGFDLWGLRHLDRLRASGEDKQLQMNENTRTEAYSVYTERKIRVVEIRQASFDKLRTNGARIMLRVNDSVHPGPVEGRAS